MNRSVGQATFGVEVDNEHGAGDRWFLKAGRPDASLLGAILVVFRV